MSLLRIDHQQKKVLAVATVLSVIFGLIFLKHYLMLIAAAAIIAFLFNPLFKWFQNKGRSVGQAAVLTFIASVLAVVIPLCLIILMSVLQFAGIIDNLADGDYSLNTDELLAQLVDFVNTILSNVGIDKTVTIDSLTASVSEAVKDFGEALAKDILSSLSSVFALITTAIIYIYVFMSILQNQQSIVTNLKRLNPLGNEISELYLQRIGSMIKATVRGQFTIAFCQGLESAAVLALVGLESWFAFFLILLSFLSLIPLGAGIVTIPLGIVLILSGNVIQGSIVIANHLLIVTNIDNVLRPRLVPANAKLDSALMILAVFSGLAFFGFIGIVLGPVIMIILQTTIQIFIEVFHETEAIDKSKSQKTSSLYRRLRERFRLS